MPVTYREPEHGFRIPCYVVYKHNDGRLWLGLEPVGSGYVIAVHADHTLVTPRNEPGWFTSWQGASDASSTRTAGLLRELSCPRLEGEESVAVHAREGKHKRIKSV